MQLEVAMQVSFGTTLFPSQFQTKEDGICHPLLFYKKF